MDASTAIMIVFVCITAVFITSMITSALRYKSDMKVLAMLLSKGDSKASEMFAKELDNKLTRIKRDA